MFLNYTDPAKGALIRAAAPTRPFRYCSIMKSLVAFTLSSLLVAAMFSPNGANGQDTTRKFRSGISGRVTDTNGAVIVRARITIVARSTGGNLIRTTNDEGQYVSDLDPDTYDVVAEANGFKTATRRSIPVFREAHSYVDFVLNQPDDVIRRVRQ
jgi:hypothetical protein